MTYKEALESGNFCILHSEEEHDDVVSFFEGLGFLVGSGAKERAYFGCKYWFFNKGSATIDRSTSTCYLRTLTFKEFLNRKFLKTELKVKLNEKTHALVTKEFLSFFYEDGAESTSLVLSNKEFDLILKRIENSSWIEITGKKIIFEVENVKVGCQRYPVSVIKELDKVRKSL